MSDADEQPFDAGDPVSVKRRRKDLSLAAREQGHALSSVMATVGGRAWMYDILVRCHVFSSSFNTNSMALAFSEGERNIGLKLIADIHEHCPNRYSEMMQEANNVRPSPNNRTRRNLNGSGRDADSDGDDNS